MKALVFGASGALGSCIRRTLELGGYEVYTAGKNKNESDKRHLQINYTQGETLDTLKQLPTLDAVVWAQGINCSDSIDKFDPLKLEALWQSNVAFIALSLSALLTNNTVHNGSRLVVVSSIWQLESRPGKFSYTISKAALQGLIKSCALDLGERGILINGVLPGVVDTPMTRSQLSEQQIAAICEQTALRRLAEPIDIAEAVAFLVSPANRVITGQFLTVDGGFIGLKHA